MPFKSQYYRSQAIERFCARLPDSNVGLFDCWPMETRHPEGYVKFGDGKGFGEVYAQRIVWGELVGPIRDGFKVWMACGTRNCVNPFHMLLFHESKMPQPPSEDPYCPEGHLVDGDNVYKDPAGYPHCQICRREARKRYKERHRSAA